MATYNLASNKTQNIVLTGLTSTQLTSALASLSAFESAVESGTRSTQSTLTVNGNTYNIAKNKTNAKVDFTYDGIKFADYASLTAYLADEATEVSTLATAEAVAAALASDKTTLTAANTTLASEKAALTAQLAAINNTAFATEQDAYNAGVAAAEAAAAAAALLNTNYILTANTDGINGGTNYTGTLGNNTFTAPIGAWTVLDVIDGVSGNDTLRISDTAAIGGTPAGAQVLNIDTVTITNTVVAAGNGVTLNTTTDAANYTGLTALNVTTLGAGATQTLTTGAAVDVTSVGQAAISVTGGKAVTATAATGNVTVANSVGAVSVTHAAQAADDILINGGTTVNVRTSGVIAGGTVTVGNTTAPTGAIVVNTTTSSTATTVQGAIGVTGGTSVTINQNSANAVNTTTTGGNVTVTGGAATTSVTVTDVAAATAGASVVGRVNGTVTINDAQAAHATNAGTISSVSLTNFGNSTVDSSALTSVTLGGTGGTFGIGRGALDAVPTANTLALNVNTLTGTNTITDSEAGADDGFTTINLANTGTSVIADLVAADLTTLNISGSGSLTLTANTLGGATTTAISSTSTGSVTLGGPLNAATAYTGGSGADTITVGATTKVISTNLGDDTVILTSATLATGGSINGGAAGSDTLQTTAAIAATASATAPLGAVFTAAVSGFEKLVLTGGGTNTVDVSRIGAFSDISTAGDTLLTLDGVTSGSTLRLTAAGTAQTINTTTALTAGTADSLNAVLTGVTTAGNVAFGSLTATNIENINVNSGYDSSMTAANITAATTGSFANQLTILGNTAKSIVVSGAAGLNLTAASTALTSVDASSNTVGSAGEFSWTAGVTTGALTVKGLAAGINTVVLSAATVAANYTGSANGDTVTIANALSNVLTLGNGTNIVDGAASGNNTVTGGSGSDTFTTATTGNNNINFGDGANAFTATTGNNTYVGGADADTVVVTDGNNNVTLGNGTNAFTAGTGNNTVTGGSGADTIIVSAGNNTVTLGDGANAFTATTGNNTYVGGAGVDTVIVGSGNNTITVGDGNDSVTVGNGLNTVNLGAGNDLVTLVGVAANGNTYTTITGFGTGDTIQFVDVGTPTGTPLGAKITLADTASFADYLNASSTADGSTNANFEWFQFGGNTFIVQDTNVSVAFTNADDQVVKLTGNIDLSASTVSAASLLAFVAVA